MKRVFLKLFLTFLKQFSRTFLHIPQIILLKSVHEQNQSLYDNIFT